MFELQDFENVFLFVWNRGYDEFVKMYNSIGLSGSDYIKEKFQISQNNSISWWLSLDKETKLKIIKYVKDFYGANK